MKKIFSLAILVLAYFNCFSQNNRSKNEWIGDYKESVCYYGILQGLNNKELSGKLTEQDKSFYNPFFYTLHEKEITKAGKYLLKLISIDYESRKGRVSEAAEGRRVMKVCLNFYASKELANMAELAYKRWVNNPNKQKLIQEVKIAY